MDLHSIAKQRSVDDANLSGMHISNCNLNVASIDDIAIADLIVVYRQANSN